MGRRPKKQEPTACSTCHTEYASRELAEKCERREQPAFSIGETISINKEIWKIVSIHAALIEGSHEFRYDIHMHTEQETRKKNKVSELILQHPKLWYLADSF